MTGSASGQQDKAVRPSTHYVTYFDRHYLTRGVALLQSLRQHSPNAVMWVICLDDQTHVALAALDLGDVRLEPLSALEARDPELAATRTTRSLLEYYYTLTAPSLLHALSIEPDIERLVYLDADTAFFADPEPLFERYGDASMLLLDHRYSPELTEEYKYGKFNVGLLVFNRTDERLPCLQLWRQQCIAWCYDYVEGDLYGDQRYLDDWPALYSGVVAPTERGIGLAPWNVRMHTFTREAGQLLADGDPVIHVHFSSTRRITARVYDTGAHRYRMSLSREAREYLYRPYVRALRSAERLLAEECGFSIDRDSIRRKRYERFGSLRYASTAMALAATARRGNLLLARDDAGRGERSA